MNQLDKLKHFVRTQVFRSRENPLARFILRHAAQGNKGSEVDAFDIPDGLDSAGIDMFVEEIASRAQDDANGLGGKLQRYALVACEAGRKDGPRYAFRLQGDGEEVEEDGDGEEKPTEKGLVSQLMRHNEALVRYNLQMTNTVSVTLARRLEQAEGMNQKLIEDRQQYLLAQEAQESEKHEREVDLLKVGMAEERKTKLLKQAENLIPVLIAKVTGSNKDSGAKDSPGMLIIKQFAKSLTQEQFQAITQTLAPDQQILLFTLIQGIQAEEQAAAKQASSPNGATS